jgi:hypothetical protein
MSYGDWMFAERLMDLQVAEKLNQAAAGRRARQAGEGRESKLFWHGRWLVCGMGYRLVMLGAWLEEYSLSRAQPVESGPR